MSNKFDELLKTAAPAAAPIASGMQAAVAVGTQAIQPTPNKSLPKEGFKSGAVTNICGIKPSLVVGGVCYYDISLFEESDKGKARVEALLKTGRLTKI